MLIISYKHYINTNSRDSAVLLRLLYDIRDALYSKNNFMVYSCAMLNPCSCDASLPRSTCRISWLCHISRKYDWILAGAGYNIWCNSDVVIMLLFMPDVLKSSFLSSSQIWLELDLAGYENITDVTKFALADRNCQIFLRPVVEFESQSTCNICVVNLTLSEMLKVGCVNKSKFVNFGFSQNSFFYYVKNVLMIGITFLHFI